VGGRWKWFLRARKVVIDLIGQALPDGGVPGRYRRVEIEDFAPDLPATSRCDGALVYQRPEEGPAAFAAYQRAESYDPSRPASGTRTEVDGEESSG
jgi:hypothetical protein